MAGDPDSLPHTRRCTYEGRDATDTACTALTPADRSHAPRAPRSSDATRRQRYCGRLSCAVPSAPRGLQLAVTQDDPPVIAASWSAPRLSHGELVGYKLTYGVRGDNYVEERRFDAHQYRFTTGFLGTIDTDSVSD